MSKASQTLRTGGLVARSGDLRLLRRIVMPDPENADPDIQRKTELDLEAEQRTRLLEAFSMIETYDGREAIIRACEKSAKLDS